MFRNILLVLLMAFSFNAVAQNKTNPCDNIPVATKDMTQNEVSTLLEACRGKTASGVAAIADTVILCGICCFVCFRSCDCHGSAN